MQDYGIDGKWYIFSHPVKVSVKHHVCTYNRQILGLQFNCANSQRQAFDVFYGEYREFLLIQFSKIICLVTITRTLILHIIKLSIYNITNAKLACFAVCHSLMISKLPFLNKVSQTFRKISDIQSRATFTTFYSNFEDMMLTMNIDRHFTI